MSDKTFNQVEINCEMISCHLLLDVAPCEACRPWIFFINGVLCFLKMNGSGMEKEER